MKVSFDFDHTLTEPRIQELAKKFISRGIDVWVTTTRNILGKDNNRVFELCSEIGIDLKKIEFTNGRDKYRYLNDFDLHFDDDNHEVVLINEFPNKCVGVLISNF